MKFSILIPSWNNLKYLQLCIESIQKNSKFQHQVIVHVNDGSDGTREWLNQNDIEFSASPENVGICTAMNSAYQLAKHDYIVYMNDDMYCLPNWDAYIVKDILDLNHSNFMISATLIEPHDTGNKAVIAKNYGDSLETFEEEKLLSNFDKLAHQDWSGSCWPPNVVHRNMWDKIGGYNELFSPGMSSDDDFAMRMWQAGCRYFKGISASRVYHFQCKSTGRIIKNNGRRTFFDLYGMTQKTFHTFYLHRGDNFTGELTEPSNSFPFLIQKIRAKMIKLFR